MDVNAIPEKLESLFSLKQLQAAGLSFLLVIIGFWLFSYMVPDAAISDYKKGTLEKVKAIEVKYNTPSFHVFMQHLQENEQVLVLGTSESVSLGQRNYYHFLNADSSIHTQFAVFSGAGRRADVYLPLMQRSPELWDNQRILLFVNPTYWRPNLNQPSSKYQTRYLSESILSTMDYEFFENDAVADWYTLDWIWKCNGWVPFLTYVQGRSDVLQNYFKPAKTLGKVSPLAAIPKSGELASFQKEIIDSLNVTQAFYDKHHGRLKMHTPTDVYGYQYQLNKEFFAQCKKRSIDLMVVFGPYNGVLTQYLGQYEAQKKYDEVHQAFIQLMDSAEVNYIDLHALSMVDDTFIDYQHHSKYGAYLIYEEIKKYYE